MRAAISIASSDTLLLSVAASAAAARAAATSDALNREEGLSTTWVE